MKKRLSAILLAFLLCSATVITACNDNGGAGSFSGGGGNSIDGGCGGSDINYGGSYEATDAEQHLVDESKLLHQKNVREVGRSFVTNRTTDYKIVVGTNDTSALEAADFLATQIERCTGAFVRVCVDANQDMVLDDETVQDRALSYDTNSKYIVYAHEKLESADYANIAWATDVDLAYSGYMIKSVGNSVFMKVNTLYGYQTVTLAFLREVLGYEWYSEDTIVYTKSGATLPDMDIVERPDFDLVNNWGLSAGAKLGSGMTKQAIFTTTRGSEFCHNSFDYIPPATYNDKNAGANYHPLWFASDDKYQTANPDATQLCYSAHGNQAEYDALLQTAYDAVMKILDAQPNASTLTFTREDKYGNCECEICSLMAREYGSLTATYMLFTNDLDDLVQAELQRRADETGAKKRELTILFFAYRETYEAPVKGSDGNYQVISAQVGENANGELKNIITSDGSQKVLPYKRTYENGLRCNKNVGVFYAPIDATYEESFYHLENKKYAQTFEKWAMVSERLYGWIYDTNFVHYLVPYNSFDSIAETLRFLKSNGCQYVFNQAQNQSVCTGFGGLKTYLNLTLSRDVNLNAGELTDKWFENYFREAEKPMREYYESLVAHMQQLEIQYPGIFYTQRRTSAEQNKFWPLAKMQSWLELCDQAYKAVEKYKTTDPELYKALVKHIKVESIFPRFMICEYYYGYYDNNAIQQERESFYQDCEEIGLKYYAERVSMTGYYTKWGVI